LIVHVRIVPTKKPTDKPTQTNFSVALSGLGILLTIAPGRRSLCSLALGYFLSLRWSFGLRLRFSRPHTREVPVKPEAI
jgi:hypothetical protein